MHKKGYILVGILMLAAGLRLWNLEGPDVVTDEAINSFRALGMVDFLSTEFQTTPLEWLQEKTWWLPLSFHDHPLLSFYIQHVFFRLFGDTLTVMRFTFALCGIVSVWLVHMLVKEVLRQAQDDDWSDGVALVSAFVLAVSGLAVWISRIAMQEAMVIASGLLIMWLGLRARDKKKYWYWFGLALGLGMMVKYTVIVYWVITCIVLLFYSRNSLRLKEFWFAHLIALVIFTPVILYNIGMYRQFGHFDLQFSYVLGQATSEWTLLPGKPIGTLGDRFLDLWRELARTMSPVMLALSGTGVLFWIYHIMAERRGSKREMERIGWIGQARPRLKVTAGQAGRISRISLIGRIGLIGMICMIGLITIMGAGARFLPMLMPFAAMAVAGLSFAVWRRAKTGWRSVVVAVGIACAVYEIGFSINSNFMIFPIGHAPWTHAQVLTQGQWWGYNELERYLHEKFDRGITTLRLQSKSPLLGSVMDAYFEARGEKIFSPLATLLVVDVNMNWFSRVWYVNRRAFYQALPVVTADDFLKVAREQGESYYREAGFEEFVFVKAEDTFRAAAMQSDAAALLANSLEARGTAPKEITRPHGIIAFKVYEFE